MTTDEPASTTVTVDGKLAEDFVDLVEICCIQAISRSKPVLLYLRDVSLIDERGRVLLRKLAEKGVGLKASGVYSSYIVDEIQYPRPNARHSRA